MRRNKNMIRCIIKGLDWEEEYKTFSEAIAAIESEEEAAASDDYHLEDALNELKAKIMFAQEDGVFDSEGRLSAECTFNEDGDMTFEVEYEEGEEDPYDIDEA
jgi:hypothetical protein